MNGGKKRCPLMSYIYDVYWQCRKTDKTFVFFSFDGNLLTYQGKALGASWVLFLVHRKASGLYIVRRRRMTVFFRLEKHEKIWNPIQGK